MKYILLNIFLLFTGFSITAQTPTIQWQKNYGGSFYDKAESIIETNEGGYVIAGHSQSSNHDLTSNLGNYDCWIIKINNTGGIVWKKTLGGSGYDYFRKIIKTPDNGYLCIGESNSPNGDIVAPFGQIDYWVIKINDAGTIEWKKNYGGSSNDWGNSVCLTNDANYIIAGHSESNDQNSSSQIGGIDFWVLKINPTGNIIWKKKYGGLQYDFLSSIIQTQDGGYAICGYSASTSGHFLQNMGGLDVWVVKIDVEGNIQWKNNFGGSLDDFSRAIIEDIDGNFVVVGETYSFDFDANENHSSEGKRDYFVIKINNLGQKIWTRCYGGENNEYARSVVQNNAGEYVIIGESYSISGQPTNNHGSAEYWLIKVNTTDGSLIWQKNYGGEGHDEPNAMLVTFDNNYIIAGNAAHPIGNGDVTNNFGDDDFWVVKLKNNECQKNLNLVADIPLGNIEFKALENITSQIKILNNTSNILYSTGKSVILNPGFKTQSGAVFEAKIEGCN